MANESVNTQPASSSPPSSSSSAADSYIGSFISLTSKYEIRYEGVLYFLNPQDSTLGLKNVKSYGTEGRKKDGPQIPPSDKVYEYILFRGSDIKDLQVKASRPPPVEEPIHNDPAIIQSQSVSGHSSSSKSPMPFSGGSSTEMSPYVEASALNMRSYPSALPSRQSGVHIVEQNPPQMTQSANLLSYAAPTNWQGYNEATTGNAYAQKHHLSAATSLPSLPNFSEASPVTVPMAFPLTSSSVSLPSIPFPTASNPVYPNIISSQSPQPLVAPPMDVHSLSLKSALSAQANVGSANPLNFSSFPPSAENANKIEASNTGKVFFNPVSLHTVQSLSHSASSVVDSSVGPMLRQTPILLTPDQLSPRLPDYSPQILYPNQKDMVVLNAAPSGSLSSVTDPANQAPLLPLESAGQQFTEEFDFEAMNEKFKKDEVWGYLGKGKQKDTAGTVQDNTTSQTSREVVGDSLTVENDSKPAYNKDDFFDSISCNTTINRSRNGQTRFSERMKLDTETFGQFQQRTHPVYGGYGPGHGHGMNRTQYGWGRGYNSGNRVRGGYMRY